MINELYEPEVLKEIGASRALGQGWNVIQLKLKEKFDIDTTIEPIKRAYNKFVSKTSEIIATDEEVKRALTKPILDTAEQLAKLNKITWDMINNDDIEDKIKVSVLKEIRSQLEMQERILSRINMSLDPSQISKIEYTKISIQNLSELEKQGKITIHRNNSGFSEKIIDAEVEDKNE
jgi:hypothetical protein